MIFLICLVVYHSLFVSLYICYFDVDVQGAAGLQDRLETAEATIESMRNDHATLRRQSQTRVSELETSNAELTEG